MLKIYGSMLCPDCVRCCDDLDQSGVRYEFLDFADSLKNLKEFLVIRESDMQFEGVRQMGSIGIPCIVEPNGKISLSWEQYVTQTKA